MVRRAAHQQRRRSIVYFGMVFSIAEAWTMSPTASARLYPVIRGSEDPPRVHASTHPAMNATPPSGVTAPKHLTPESARA